MDYENEIQQAKQDPPKIETVIYAEPEKLRARLHNEIGDVRNALMGGEEIYSDVITQIGKAKNGIYHCNLHARFRTDDNSLLVTWLVLCEFSRQRGGMSKLKVWYRPFNSLESIIQRYIKSLESIPRDEHEKALKTKKPKKKTENNEPPTGFIPYDKHYRAWKIIQDMEEKGNKVEKIMQVLSDRGLPHSRTSYFKIKREGHAGKLENPRLD